MKNEQLLKDILESKKVKSANRKPRYATRKLSIGLVSCLLGFITFVGVPHGQIAYAEENVTKTTAIEEKVKKKEVVETTENLMRVKETEEEEIEDNSLMVEAEKDIDKEKQIKKRIDTAGLQNLETEPKEEEQIAVAKNEDPATETKEETQAPAPTEEKKEEKPVSEEEKKDEKDSEETEKKETKSEEKLEISDQKAVDQLSEPSGEEAGNDISSQLEELKVNLYANNEAKNGTKVTPLRGPVDANEGQDIGMDISFYVPKTVKKGDYFDIKLSDTVNGYGATSKDVAYKPKLYVGDDVVAEGSYDPKTNTFRYVFTEAAQKYGRFRQDINEVLYVDPKNVKNSKDGVEVSANLNGETKKKFDVDYSLELNEGDVEIPSNGAGTINELKENKDLGEKKGTYEQTYYVNYAGKEQNGTELTFENNDKAGDHGITTESEAIFDDDVLNSVKVYKVKDPSKLNGSFYVEDDNIEEVTPDKYDKELITTGNGLENNGMKIKFKNQGSTDTYVVKYQGKYDPKKFVQIKSTLIADPNESYSSAVHASTVSLKSSKSAPKADEGFFWENHIFQTLDEDGNVVSTDFIHDFVNYAHGTKEETYRTEKQDVAGYEIYKVENQEDAQADSLGNETTGHFVKGKRSKALYFYRKIGDSYTVWVDEEGNDVKKPENGLKEKIADPEGYKFVESEPTKTLGNGAKKNKHIYHKIVTRYVEEGPDAKELKEKVDGAHPDTEGNVVENYKKVDEKTDPKTGDVTNIYHKIITKWVDEEGKVLRGPEDGAKPDNDGVWDIPEYKLVGEPKVDPKTGDVTNIYKKIEVNYTSWVDDEGNRIKQPEKDLLEKGQDPEGYRFTGTTEEKDGDTTRRIHHYHKIITKWVDNKGNVLKPKEYGAHPDLDKNDIKDHFYLAHRIEDNGDVVNIYNKVVTKWIDNELNILKPQEDGAKPDTDKNDIDNYKWVKTVTDDETGNVTNVYRKIKTRWVDINGAQLQPEKDGSHPDDDGEWDIPGYGLVSSDTNVETGDVTNVYQKIVPPYTVWVDEEGKQIKELEDGLQEPGDDPEGYKRIDTKDEELPDGGSKRTHIYHKIVTKYVDEGGKEIPGNPPEVGAKEKKEIPGYEYVGEKTDEKGNVTHTYKKKIKKTSYVDLNGKEINPPEDGTHEKKEISGYTFDKTETDEDGNVKHIYKKVVVKTSYVDEDGGEIKDNPPVEGIQEKKDIPGYKFVETKNEDNGDVTHVYKKISPKTSYVDDKGNPIPNNPPEDGEKDPKKITGYSYQGKEKDKDGNTIHKYHKIVTKYVDENGNPISDKPQEDGEKEKKDIQGYEYVEKKVDDKTKDVIHVYKKKTPKTSYVDDKGNPIPKNPTEDGEKDPKEIPGYSYQGKEKDKDGNIIHKYHKIVTKYVDEDGKEIPNNPQEDGEKEKKEIPGYEYVEKKVDDKTKDISHVYKKKPTPPTPEIPVKPIEDITIWVDEDGYPIKDPEDGTVERGDDPDGYEFVETWKHIEGKTVHVYRKKAKEAGKIEEKETPKETPAETPKDKETPKETPKDKETPKEKETSKAEGSSDKVSKAKAKAKDGKADRPNVKTGVESLVSPLLALISAGAGLSLLGKKKKEEE